MRLTEIVLEQHGEAVLPDLFVHQEPARLVQLTERAEVHRPDWERLALSLGVQAIQRDQRWRRMLACTHKSAGTLAQSPELTFNRHDGREVAFAVRVGVEAEGQRALDRVAGALRRLAVVAAEDGQVDAADAVLLAGQRGPELAARAASGQRKAGRDASLGFISLRAFG